MSDLPVLAGSSGPKFLLSKEKASRWAFGLGYAVIAVVTGIYTLPYVIQFATLGIEAGYKLAVLGVELSAIAAVIGFALNSRVQASAWYLYMGWVDALALRVAKVSPVARVKAYVTHYLEPMKVKNEELLVKARGREKSALRRLEETTEAHRVAERRAEYCQEHGNPTGSKWIDKKLHNEFSVLSAKIHPMKAAIKRLEKRLAFQRGLVTVLDDLQSVIDAYIEVTRFNVDMMVQEYESAEEAAEGTRELQGMLGASEKTKLYNLSAQHLMSQTDQLLAEVEGVMSVVQQRINEGKIDDAIGEEDLIRQLMGRVGSISTFAEGQRQLAQGGDAVLLTAARTQVLQEARPEPKRIGTSSTPSSSRFTRLLPPKE